MHKYVIQSFLLAVFSSTLVLSGSFMRTDKISACVLGLFSDVKIKIMPAWPSQSRPTGDNQPGIRPGLQRRAGEPEAESAEVAVGDRGPLGLWAWLCPGGQTGAALQTTLQWTIMVLLLLVIDMMPTWTHPSYEINEIQYQYFCMSAALRQNN